MSDWEGNCNVMWSGGDLEILHADPRVTISKDLIDRVSDGYGHPAVSLIDGVLTIRGTNRTAVYRLGEYVPDVDGYRAEWPD